MAYTATYASSDIAPAVIDILGNFLAGFASEADTLAVIAVITLVIGGAATVIGLLVYKFFKIRG